MEANVGVFSHWAARGATILLVLLLLVGCEGEVRRQWTEEVELDNGTVIRISRHVRFTESNSIAGDAYSSSIVESTLRFNEELEALPAWKAPLVPILLYVDPVTEEWSVVATTSSCERWIDRGAPAPPYWEFRLNANGWAEVPLSPGSIGRETNLFFNFEPGLPSREMPVAVKKHIIRQNNFAREYLKIVADVKNYCNYVPRRKE